MYDAIVIGSRCAGAPTAMLLARRGRRVLVVDRATFPSDVLSGHTIQPAGIARLARWGLLDRVRATGVPFLDTVRFDFGPVVLEGTPAPIDGISDAVCIRRTIIDTLLTDAAAEAGAEVRQGFTVKELLWDGGRVVGIRGRDATGDTVEERAAHRDRRRRHQLLRGPRRRGADLPRTGHRDGQRLLLLARRRPRPHRALHPARAGSSWRSPPTTACRSWHRSCPPTRPTATEAAPRTPSPRRSPRCRTSPSGCNAGQRVERFRWAPVGDGFFRQAGGPGWALVGDAGYHKDPITAQGMVDAFRDAELLADAVDRGLDGDLAVELAGYQQARDAAAMPMYEFTCGLADIEAPPTARDARPDRRPRRQPRPDLPVPRA